MECFCLLVFPFIHRHCRVNLVKYKLCTCASVHVCVHVRAHVLAQMGVASEGTACCCVKRMVFFNCAGNPRLKTGDAIAKVR